MERELEGKVLLVLGGLRRSIFLVNRAKRMGIHVIVADYLPIKDSPAKQFADEFVMLDATNVDAIVNFCRSRKVDGIITAHADILLFPCYLAAQELGLPCYLTEKMISLSTNKENFKSECRRFNICVPETYEIGNENTSDLPFPVFIKPLDGSGSRGASVCYDHNDFKNKFLEAMKWSSRGKVTVEEFLSGSDIGVDYLISEGQPFLLSMWDRFMCKDRPIAVNHANLQMLPSRFLNLYIDSVHEKVVDMLKSLGFQNGIIFFQGYVSENKITFFEMGCRLGSTWNYIDEYFNGFNPMDCLISHSLTGKMFVESNPNINPKFKGYGSVLSLIAKHIKGTVSTIKGIEQIKKIPEVKCIMQSVFEEQTFNASRQTDMALLRVQLAANHLDEIIDAINEIYSTTDFYDDRGESLLSEFYPTKSLMTIYADLRRGGGGIILLLYMLLAYLMRLHWRSAHEQESYGHWSNTRRNPSCEGFSRFRLLRDCCEQRCA